MDSIDVKNDYSDEIKTLMKGKTLNKRQMPQRSKVLKVGLKTTVGAGAGVLVGALGGVAAAALLEVIIPTLLITKTAAVVGGAIGMLKGVKDVQNEESFIQEI